MVSLIVTMIRSALCDDRDHGPGLAGRGGDHVVSAPRDGRDTAVLELQSGATAVHIGVTPDDALQPGAERSAASSLSLVARGGSLRTGGIAASAAQQEHVDQDQHRARQAPIPHPDASPRRPRSTSAPGTGHATTPQPETAAPPSRRMGELRLTSATVGLRRSPGSTKLAATTLRRRAIGGEARAAVARSRARGAAVVSDRSPTRVMATACPAAPCREQVRCTTSAPVDNAAELMDAPRTPPPH
jgi:hypothetical protein